MVENVKESLHDLVIESRLQLKMFRDNYRTYKCAYAGRYYGQDVQSANREENETINPLEITINTYLTHLASQTPQVNVNTFTKALKPSANKMRLVINQLFRRCEFGKTLREVTVDAMFGMGITKVGTAITDESYHAQSGEVYISRISPHDWVHDTSAKSYDKVAFAGHKFKMTEEELKSNPDFNQEVVKEILDSGMKKDPDGNDEFGSDYEHGSLAHEGHQSVESMYPHVWIWELWCPGEGKLKLLPVDPAYDLLYEEDYEGPKDGPYVTLQLGSTVTDDILPSPPAGYLFDMDALIKKLYTRLGKGALRAKTLITTDGSDEQYINQVLQAQDGDTAVKTNMTSTLDELHVGGMDNSSVMAAIHMRDVYMGPLTGNLDALAGLGPQSETASQDRMITASASKKMAGMMVAVMEHAKGVCEKTGYEVWHDPDLSETVTYPIPGTSIETELNVNAESLLGTYESYDMDIVPHSTVYKAPSDVLEAVGGVWDRYVAPLLGTPLLPAVAPIVALHAEYMNIPEMDRAFSQFFDAPPRAEDEMGQTPIDTPQQPNTSRTYNRVNISGSGTRQGKDQVLQLAAMGSDSQAAEKVPLLGGNG